MAISETTDVSFLASRERRKYLTFEVLALSGVSIAQVLIFCGYEIAQTVSSNLGRIPTKFFLFELSPYIQLSFVGPASVVKGLSFGAIYLFAVWISGDALSRFGFNLQWKPIDWLTILIAIAGPTAILWGSIHLFQDRPAWNAVRFLLNKGLGDGWMVCSVLTTTIATEFFFRSYLIARLEELIGSTTFAVFAQALFYAFWCGTGMLPQLLVGLWLGAIFSKARTIWPLVIGMTAVRVGLSYWMRHYHHAPSLF